MSRISDLAGFTTSLSTTQDLSVGIITATTFSGDGSGLTGVASTDNIQTATDARFLANVNITGVTTATGGFVGNVTGNATGLSGEPDITVTNVTGAAATFLSNVTIGGTLTYQDVTNMDVLGIGTFQQGIQVLANGINVTGIVTVGSATSITDGAISATRFHGDGSNLTGISVGISTESITATDQSIATLDLSKDVHKVNVSGVATIDCKGGSEYATHIITIVNTGIATVGFSTYFLFPSGSEPSLPTASGTISQLSFTVHRVGAAGTQVLATAALNFS